MQQSEEDEFELQLGFILRRGLAFLLDLSIVSMLGYTFFPYASEDFSLWASILLVALPFGIVEGLLRSTPGKCVSGLYLKLEGGFFVCWAKGLMRHLVKWGGLFVILWGALFAQQPFGSLVILLILTVLSINFAFFNGFFWGGNGGWLGQTRPLESPQSLRHDVFFIGFATLVFLLGWMIWLPHITFDHRQSRISSVKANMHTFQTMLETYAVEWNGAYPDSLRALYQAAQRPETFYWKEFSNPYTGKAGIDLSMQLESQPPQEGVVSYAPESVRNGVITRYWIYGYSKNAKRIRDRTQDFYLSNSR